MTTITITITRTIEVQDPLPDNIIDALEDKISVDYPIDCKEIDGSVEATIV